MSERLVALLVFLALASASLGCLFAYERLPPRHRQDDTQNVVRLVANIFVVMTSLVLGLMINSAKGRFDAVNRDVHAYATGLILLDRTLRLCGPEAVDTRQRLLVYTRRAADGRWTSGDPLLVPDRTSERLLDDVGSSLAAARPADAEQAGAWNRAWIQYQKVVELRWTFLEQAEGSIPRPLLAIVIAWLVLIFGSFGYRAPRNRVVAMSFVLSAALLAGAFYLILDMDVPFAGLIQVSPAPLRRAVAEMQG